MSEEEVVTYELEGQIALVGLNRPDKRNCFNPTVMKQLREAIDAYREKRFEFKVLERDDVHVVVQGRGSDGFAFSADPFQNGPQGNPSKSWGTSDT